MTRSPSVLAAALALALSLSSTPCAAVEDLMEIYREAQRNDPALAAARANWEATQERVPQARAGLLPNVSLSASANGNYFGTNVDTDPRVNVDRSFAAGGLTVSASQPLYRYANQVAYSQAVQQVEQADYTLALARQDLILRVAIAYFDVLLAEFNVDVTLSQKAAVSEQLAQAKRNFEVGVATITDTNEAQAKYDSIVAQEILTRNDLENKRTALRAIIGRFPRELKRLGGGFEPMPPTPNTLDAWVDQALTENLSVKIARYNADIATLEIERQRAGHLPTLDLVASANALAGSGSVNTDRFNDTRQAQIGVALNVPLYFIRLKVKTLDPKTPYIAVCDTGRRSSAAAFLLSERGFDAYCLEGGMTANKLGPE